MRSKINITKEQTLLMKSIQANTHNQGANTPNEIQQHNQGANTPNEIQQHNQGVNTPDEIQQS